MFQNADAWGNTFQLPIALGKNLNMLGMNLQTRII